MRPFSWYFEKVFLVAGSALSHLAAGPITEADRFPNLPTFVAVLLSLLGTTLHVFHVMPMVLDHFHDLFVGLRHDDSASLRDPA